MPTTKKIGFEESLRNLKDIVKQLENGEIELEKAMKLYEQGIKLAAECETMIKTAKLKIEELKSEDEG